ncbi:MAG: DUF975 family protein [Bacteroidales bacterium]|nr:DUF975 family protein [Bacteroidales bacterium]
MRTNQEYKNAALDRLRGNWVPTVIASLIVIFTELILIGCVQVPYYLQMGFSAYGGTAGGSLLLGIFFLYPLLVGFENALRLLYERGDDRVTGNMVRIALSNYLHKVGGMLLMFLKIALWSFLLVLPGFVMAFAYSMTPYILEEYPEIGAWEASTRSREMMRGHKFDLFWLLLSFIGWGLLSILTLGVGLIWLLPYMDTSMAAFYNDLKAEQKAKSVTE